MCKRWDQVLFHPQLGQHLNQFYIVQSETTVITVMGIVCSANLYSYSQCIKRLKFHLCQNYKFRELFICKGVRYGRFYNKQWVMEKYVSEINGCSYL